MVKPRGPRDSIYRLLIRIPKAVWQSLKVFGELGKEYKVFVSSGSNHSLCPALIAKLRKFKIFNIESSVRMTSPSKATKIMDMFSDVTVAQWPEQLSFFKHAKLYGPLYEYPEYEIRDEGYIVVTGGTYGFKQLFDIISELNYDRVVLQTGRVDPKQYKEKNPKWIVFDFDPEFNRWIARASVVVSHLGKTVIDAALTYRKPVVIVPNPEWRLTAGIHDAEILAKKLNAVLVKTLNAKTLENAIEEAKKRKPPTYPDGAKMLAEELLSYLKR